MMFFFHRQIKVEGLLFQGNPIFLSYWPESAEAGSIKTQFWVQCNSAVFVGLGTHPKSSSPPLLLSSLRFFFILSLKKKSPDTN